MQFKNFEEQAAYLCMGGAEILPSGQEALIAKLKKAASENRPLRVKLGIDPTGADLHLGHTVCLQLLKRFQNLGHTPLLLIGGFTAQLGDPTGRNEARPPLSEEQVKENSATFLEQAGKVLDLSQTEIVNNADWLSGLNLSEVLKLASTTTINQLIAKEAFGERLEKGFPLYLHEIFYPILQGYDSVALKADIEIGGQDQRFNLLAGRDLQKHFGQDSQIAILMPLLVGLDGKKKMSKTSNNYIALLDKPEEIFGKTMSLPDELLKSWFELVLPISLERLAELQNKMQANINPRDLKMELACEIISLYYSSQAAQEAQEDFIAKFQKKEIPANIPEFKLEEGKSLIDILFESGLVASKGEGKRLIAGQGIQINSQKALLDSVVVSGDIIQVGKRKFVKLI